MRWKDGVGYCIVCAVRNGPGSRMVAYQDAMTICVSRILMVLGKSANGLT